MPEERLIVGVVVGRRRLASPWAEAAWLPLAVLPGAPAAAPWTVLEAAPDETRFFAGPADLVFHSGETAHYRDNLVSGRPSLWVALRPVDDPPGIRVLAVTADPSEGEAFTEAGADIVEPVPMHPDLAERLTAFVAEHHVERAFFKRQRDRQDPDSLGRRGGRGTPAMADDDE